ncbi:MAG: hypothetical protein EOO37_05575 [Cytophagaceae bacterium]|nr:MAG: hypothetical protein EOO37_05575 [Cytophagaceae bacterium]
MAYSDFTIERLSTDFGVNFQGADLFDQVPVLEPSAWLTTTIDIARQVGYGNEKSRSERLVSPVLLELAHRNAHQFAIVSGGNLDVDPARGLNGECDFVLSFTRLKDFIKAPVFCITEAKKQDMEWGLIQCAAQLVGASRLNEREQKAIPVLYGCSTTGIEWQFLKFENQVFTLDENSYLINEPGRLLGVLQHIVDQTKPMV